MLISKCDECLPCVSGQVEVIALVFEVTKVFDAMREKLVAGLFATHANKSSSFWSRLRQVEVKLNV